MARLGDEPLARFTAKTLADLPALLAALQAIRARGFTLDREEYTPGWCGWPCRCSNAPAQPA
jgi:DNA-binding IclR family transcriptional regulator